MLDPGDVVVTEVPTYLGALGALHWSGCRIVGVDGDADGLRTDLLEERLRAGLRPKLVYVVADFANPTGATLSQRRRIHLARLADRFGFVIVEDDPYGALRWRGVRLAPVRAWSDRVVTLGTASKVVAPGLRVGWLTAPEWLAPSIVIAKQGADLHTSTLNQWIVDDLLGDERWFEAHVSRLVGSYGARCAALVEALGGILDVTAPDGGMFVWGALAESVDQRLGAVDRRIGPRRRLRPGSGVPSRRRRRPPPAAVLHHARRGRLGGCSRTVGSDDQ